MDFKRYLKDYPDQNGRFGEYGGAYLSDELIPAFEEIADAYQTICHSSQFINELRRIRKEFQGRPTPVYHCEKLSREIGSCQIYLKREDLNHTGAHKLNHCMGEGLLAEYMGKKRLIAETGAGQHGVATATVAAKFGLECKVFMGSEDIKRQNINVKKMELLGTEVVPVTNGLGTLNDAVTEAIRYWAANVEDTFYVIGSALGPHPYPTMVRNFQRVIGDEAREQILEMEHKFPDYVLAPVGGGSNSIGIFYPFVDDKDVKLIGVEGAGKGIETDEHAAAMSKKQKGILHGMLSYVLQDDDGRIQEAYSISAGLDYPGVGPEHSYLAQSKRADYVSITDDEAVDAFMYLTKLEGIVPALESSHAVAYAKKLAPTLNKDQVIIVNLSGRGDKDMDAILSYLSKKDE